jgi:membrane-associated phospholipid phosphatase
VQQIVSRRRLIPRPVRPAGWWFDVLLLAGFAALTAALATGALLDLDAAVRDWCITHQAPAADRVARVLNFLGNGGPLTTLSLAAAALIGGYRRSVRPILPVVAAFLLTTFAILPLKVWTDRAAPASLVPDRVRLFNDLPAGEYSWSYPSGHLVNAVVWYGVLALLLTRWLPPAARQLLRAAPPVIVFGTTVYLGYHWVTDSVAGLLLGVVLTRLLARVPWDDPPLPSWLSGWSRPGLWP